MVLFFTGTHFGANTPLFLGYSSPGIILEYGRERQTYTECHKVSPKLRKESILLQLLGPCTGSQLDTELNTTYQLPAMVLFNVYIYEMFAEWSGLLHLQALVR